MMKRKASTDQGVKASSRCRTTLAPSLRLRRSFTLTELLAAMAIIVVIAGVTVVSVQSLAREARLSSAVNTIAAALDTGRAMAIHEETFVAVVFRARLVSDNKQQIEIVTARWTGESPTIQVVSSPDVIDRFEPIPGIASRRLPAGISIAGPLVDFFGFSGDVGDYWDRIWGYMSYLPDVAVAEGGAMGNGDPPGRLFAVIYSPNGTVVMRNAQSNALRMFVDFNNDDIQQVAGCTACGGEVDYGDSPSAPGFPVFNIYMMQQMAPNDEPYLSPVPYFAVYNEDNFRDTYTPSDWFDVEGGNPEGWALKHQHLTEFVNENGKRIHFNRYTGVALR